MNDTQSLQHTRWECKYHVISIPKYGKKAIYGEIRRHLGQVLRRLAEQKESQIEEGHPMSDHVHVLISIPPKYSVAQVVDLSRARARYTSREPSESGGRTSPGSISGRGDTM